MPPGAVERPRQDLDACGAEPLGLGVDVPDDEADLARRLEPAVAQEFVQASAVVQSELRRATIELDVAVAGSAYPEARDLAIEGDRSVEVGDVQDHVVDVSGWGFHEDHPARPGADSMRSWPRRSSSDSPE
jgi:hypothetical protein